MTSSYELSFIYGRPCSGKTEAMQTIESRYPIDYLSVGNIVRKEMERGTPVGLELKGYLDRVEEYPAELIGRVMGPHILSNTGRPKVLDGFPKYGREVHWFEKFVFRESVLLGSVAIVNITLEEAKRRVVGRKHCATCQLMVGQSEDSNHNCPRCNGELKTRSDDEPEILERRFRDFDEYMKQTLPVLKRMTASIVEIDGMRDREQVVKDILSVFKLEYDSKPE